MRAAVLIALAVTACRPVDVTSLVFRCASDDECVDGAFCDERTKTCRFTPGETPRDGGVDLGPPRIEEIVTTADFACSRRGGEVSCWGAYDRGCTTSCMQVSPTPVATGILDATRIFGGGSASHVCVERSGGAIVCIDRDGERRDPMFATSPSAVAVGTRFACGITETTFECQPIGPQGVQDTIEGGPFTNVVAGEDWACALTDGRAACFVYDNRFDDLLGMRDVDQLAAGARFMCVRRTSGDVVCGGEEPPVRNFAAADEVFAGGNVACVRRNDTVECGGRWRDLTFTEQAAPSELSLSAEASFHVGTYAGCALDRGVVSCVGAGPHGQLGPAVPVVQAPGVITASVAVAGAGARRTCVADAAGDVRCFGSNDDGVFGGAERALLPSDIAGLAPAAEFSIGERHVCAVGTDGVLRCLDGTSEAGPFVDAAGDDGLLCALTTDGRVFCRGGGFSATFEDTNAPDVVTAIGGVRTVCAVMAGRVACVGTNLEEEPLIDPAGPALITTWTDIPGLDTDMVDVDVGLNAGCALDTGGVAHCWGYNNFGQLGRGNFSDVGDRLAPAAISGVRFRQLDAGILNFCGVDTTGGVQCWGQSWVARLGALGPDRPSPTPVRLLSNVERVHVGREFGCARHDTDRLSCWGWHAGGVLGVLPASDTFVGVQQ